MKKLTILFSLFLSVDAFVSPVSSYTYFDSISWVQRGVQSSLQLMPKGSVIPATIEDAWDEVLAVASSDMEWQVYANSSGLRNQFICHVHWAQFKKPWNIEPWRESSNYTCVVLAGCNPAQRIQPQCIYVGNTWVCPLRTPLEEE